jgi:hypothetical protein
VCGHTSSYTMSRSSRGRSKKRKGQVKICSSLNHSQCGECFRATVSGYAALSQCSVGKGLVVLNTLEEDSGSQVVGEICAGPRNTVFLNRRRGTGESSYISGEISCPGSHVPNNRKQLIELSRATGTEPSHELRAPRPTTCTIHFPPVYPIPAAYF